MKGPQCPCVNLLAQQPFRFDPPRSSPPKDASGDGGSDHLPSPHQPSRGQECNRCQRDQRPPSPQFPSPSPDCGFESYQSLLLTAYSMLSRLDQSDGSRHSRQGRWHQEEGACMKINLSILKDEDAKDAVTYQSWRWDLMVYWHAGCRDCTLLPYAIRSLQGYPGELVWSSGMDITLDNVLTILDEQYNNVKVLDELNQELFQLQMADKETVSDWGVCLLRNLQVLAASFPDHFPPHCVVEEGSLLQQTSQAIKSNGSLPEGRPTGEDILSLPKGHQGGCKGRFYRAAPRPQNPNCWWSPQTKDC